MKELIRKHRAKVLEIDTKPGYILLISNVDNTAMPECNFHYSRSMYLYIARSTRATDLHVLAPFHVQALNTINSKVSEPRMFYRKLSFIVQTAKVFPLERFVVYGS